MKNIVVSGLKTVMHVVPVVMHADMEPGHREKQMVAMKNNIGISLVISGEESTQSA